jgi:hypothetical protein
VDLATGKTLTLFVEESLGNLGNPLNDAQLEDKFRDQAVLALPAAVVEQLIQSCWKLDTLPDVGMLCRATVPTG